MENERHKKLSIWIFKLIKEHLPTVLTILSLYYAVLFTFPYFIYYRFIPDDSLFFNTKVVYITVVSFVLFYLLAIVLGLAIYTHLYSLMKLRKKLDLIALKEKIKNVKLSEIWSKIQKVRKIIITKIKLIFIIVMLFLIECILLFANSFPFRFLLFMVVLITILDLLGISILKTEISEHKEQEKKSKSEDNKDLWLLFFMSSIGIIFFSWLYVDVSFGIKSQNFIDTGASIIIILVLFYILAFIYVPEEEKKTPLRIIILMFFFLFIPLFFLQFFPKGYINLLEKVYTKIGIASNSSTFYVKYDMCNLIQKELNSKNLCNFYKSIITDEGTYFSVEGIKIVWNGSKFIYITEPENAKKTVPIPKSALLNGDIITQFKE